jgi:hypothetical protein
METFFIEVDVALRRPPSPENVVTTYHVVATDRGIVDAELTAIAMAVTTRKVVMPTATRVTCVEI